MAEVEHQKCGRCKTWRLPESFLNPKGRKLKTCQSCRDRAKATRQRNKCPHNRRKTRCKDCGGSQICEHNRIRTQCKECGGASICKHKRQRSQCKECGGASICEHNRRRNRCKECGGASICKHNRERRKCKECGGSQICEHNRLRSHCKECGGASICKHNRRRRECKECDPIGHLSSIVQKRCRSALKSKKSKRTMEYVGCTIEEFKAHISSQFKEGMSWDNHGKWHIDHIIPLKYNNPSIEETIERLHYTNTQPLWATDNIAKGNRFIG